MPGVGVPPGIMDGPSMRARLSSATINPPLEARTAQITATRPTSMMRPWMKSFTAVAM